MKGKNCFCIVLMTLIIAVAGNVFADSLGSASDFRCRGKIVSTGDTQYDVMKKCKKPAYEARNGNVWVYDFGPYRLTYYVVFLDGRVHRIRTAPHSR